MENNNQNQSNKPQYKNGEKYPYNRFEDTFGDAGKYSDETPIKRVFLNNTHKIIFAVIAGLVTVGAIVLCVIMSLGYIG